MSADMRVWVGCLGCYNDGRLVGEWVDAADAPETMDDWVELVDNANAWGAEAKRLHIAYGHEELWCLDQEGLAPFIEGECSPVAARELAEALDDLDDHELRLLRLYVEGLGRGYWTRPDWQAIAEEATDHYVGEAESLAGWAQDFADEMGLFSQYTVRDRNFRERKLEDDDVMQVILRNIDWDGVAQEWTEGYTIVRDNERGVLVLFSH